MKLEFNKKELKALKDIIRSSELSKVGKAFCFANKYTFISGIFKYILNGRNLTLKQGKEIKKTIECRVIAQTREYDENLKKEITGG